MQADIAILSHCSSSKVMDSSSFARRKNTWLGSSSRPYPHVAHINWGISSDPSIAELSWAFPSLVVDQCFCTHLSSGSSFSSLVGVTLRPPFLARGQPDKLKEAHRIKATSFCHCLPRTLSAAGLGDGGAFTFCGMHSSLSRGQSHHSQVLGTCGIIRGAYKIQLQRYTVNNM